MAAVDQGRKVQVPVAAEVSVPEMHTVNLFVGVIASAEVAVVEHIEVAVVEHIEEAVAVVGNIEEVVAVHIEVVVAVHIEVAVAEHIEVAVVEHTVAVAMPVLHTDPLSGLSVTKGVVEKLLLDLQEALEW